MHIHKLTVPIPNNKLGDFVSDISANVKVDTNNAKPNIIKIINIIFVDLFIIY